MAKMHYCEKTKRYFKCRLPDYCQCQKPASKKEVRDIAVGSITQEYPNYENEHFLFTEEMRQHVKEFRKQRNEWKNSVIDLDVKTINESVLEEEISSDVYKGRFILLRKMRFKINRLRNHHQTIRPLKYYTLNRVPFEVKKEKECIESSKLTLREKGERENLNVCKKRKSKKVKIAKVESKTVESAKRIMHKLKGKKRGGGKSKLEPCRCEDGKEVTFIIKGVCLCDKEKMKAFTAKEIRNDFKKPAKGKKFNLPQLSDSLDLYRKIIKEKDLKESEKPVKDSEGVDSRKKDEKSGKKTSASVKFASEEEISKEEKPQETTAVQKEGDVNNEETKSTNPRKERPKESAGDDDQKNQQAKEDRKAQGEENGNQKEAEEPTVTEKPPSLVTLYKNRYTAKKSDSALTKEQKRIIDAYNKKKKKKNQKGVLESGLLV